MTNNENENMSIYLGKRAYFQLLLHVKLLQQVQLGHN